MDDVGARCPRCGRGVRAEDRFCGRCGAAFAAGEQLVPRRADEPAAAARSLPEKFGPVGKALAAGAAVLAVDAALAWLRRKAGPASRPSLPATRDAPDVHGYLIGQSLEEVLFRARAGDSRDLLFARRAVRVLRVSESSKGHL